MFVLEKSEDKRELYGQVMTDLVAKWDTKVRGETGGYQGGCNQWCMVEAVGTKNQGKHGW